MIAYTEYYCLERVTGYTELAKTIHWVSKDCLVLCVRRTKTDDTWKDIYLTKFLVHSDNVQYVRLLS